MYIDLPHSIKNAVNPASINITHNASISGISSIVAINAKKNTKINSRDNSVINLAGSSLS
jgi:precorrin-2 methylase